MKPDRPQARLVSRGDATRIIPIGLEPRRLDDMYVRLLGASWLQTLCILSIVYFILNILFATAYYASGNGIENARPDSFADAFFFSVQTLATIGYGKMAPHSLAANILVTFEAFCGFGFYALTTGLIFSKFSRPTSRLTFSKVAVICPYNGVPHLMLRIANKRRNRIVDATIQMVLFKNEVTSEGHEMRRFYDLTLARSKVPFLQLTWTVMHPIDAASPFYNLSKEMLCGEQSELVITLTGLDETLSQTIHARYSYIAEEILFDSVFEDIIVRHPDQSIEVHYERFHETKPFVANATPASARGSKSQT